MKSKKSEKASENSNHSMASAKSMKSPKNQKLEETPMNAHERAPTEYVGNKIKYRDVSQEISEIQAYSTFMNKHLANDPLLSKILPLNTDPDHLNLYEKIQDGVLLMKLVNLIHEGSIDEKKFKKISNMSMHKKTDNVQTAINAAQSLGCNIVSIHAEDIMEKKSNQVLGLLWQMIRLYFMKDISLAACPELILLAQDNETEIDIGKLSTEQILIRWINYHVKHFQGEENSTYEMRSFLDVHKSPEVFGMLLSNLDPINAPMPSLDPEKRQDPAYNLQIAQLALDNASAMGIPTFLLPRDLCQGTNRLVTIFAAQIFNFKHGLELKVETSEQSNEMVSLDVFEADGDVKEAKETPETPPADAKKERSISFYGIEVEDNGNEDNSSSTPPTFKKGRNGSFYRFEGSGGSSHSISEDETVAFFTHLNNCLASNPLLSKHLPFDPYAEDNYTKFQDGLILTEFLNLIKPGVIDTSTINKGSKLNIYQKTENLNKVVKFAAETGIRMINIGSRDILDGRPVPIMGMLWQLIRLQLLSHLNFRDVPELVVLTKPGESKEDLHALTSEQLLLRWVNYHLERSKSGIVVKNFGEDMKDPYVFSILLAELETFLYEVAPPGTAPLKIAEGVLDGASKIGVKSFLTPQDFLRCNPKLHLGFAAQLFHARHGLSLPDVELNRGVELLVLANEGESMDELSLLASAEILTRWINHILNAAGSERTIVDVETDMTDPMLLMTLLTYLCNQKPEQRHISPRTSYNNQSFYRAVDFSPYEDLLVADDVLNLASAQLGVDIAYLDPKDLCSNTGSSFKLMRFIGSIFNAHNALEFPPVILHKNATVLTLAIDNETPEDVFAMSNEETLLRWVNYHLREEESGRYISNFGDDMKDALVFCMLLYAIDPYSVISVDEHVDPIYVARCTLEGLWYFGIKTSLRAVDLCCGHAGLNRTLLAQIFNVKNGLGYPNIPLVIPPEYIVTLEDGEDAQLLESMTNEAVILRWVNYIFQNSEVDMTSSEPIADLDPEYMDLKKLSTFLCLVAHELLNKSEYDDDEAYAVHIIRSCETLGIKLYLEMEELLEEYSAEMMLYILSKVFITRHGLKFPPKREVPMTVLRIRQGFCQFPAYQPQERVMTETQDTIPRIEASASMKGIVIKAEPKPPSLPVVKSTKEIVTYQSHQYVYIVILLVMLYPLSIIFSCAYGYRSYYTSVPLGCTLCHDHAVCPSVLVEKINLEERARRQREQEEFELKQRELRDIKSTKNDLWKELHLIQAAGNKYRSKLQDIKEIMSSYDLPNISNQFKSVEQQLARHQSHYETQTMTERSAERHVIVNELQSIKGKLETKKELLTSKREDVMTIQTNIKGSMGDLTSLIKRSNDFKSTIIGSGIDIGDYFDDLQIVSSEFDDLNRSTQSIENNQINQLSKVKSILKQLNTLLDVILQLERTDEIEEQKRKAAAAAVTQSNNETEREMESVAEAYRRQMKRSAHHVNCKMRSDGRHDCTTQPKGSFVNAVASGGEAVKSMFDRFFEDMKFYHTLDHHH